MGEENTKENNQDMIKNKMDKVIKMLISQAEEGDADACCKLANIYIAYSKNIKDYIKAYQLAFKAYKAGNLESAFLLGEMNQFGTGCEKNSIRAKYYYYKLLRLPDLQERLGKTTIIDLYCNLGKLYMSEKNKLWGNYRAKMYFQKALALDGKEAEQYLQDIEDHLGFYKKEFIGKVAFYICFIIMGFWAYGEIKEKCQPLYEHIYDSVITDAVRVSNGEVSDKQEDQSRTDNQKKDSKDSMLSSDQYKILNTSDFQSITLNELSSSSSEASSEVTNSVGLNYPVSNTLDGKKYTCWQENETGDGIGETLTYNFDKEETISAISFYNGNSRNEKAFYSHNRLQNISLQNEETIQLNDSMEEQFIIFDKPLTTAQIKITIDSVYAADGNHETCLSEIHFFTKQ